MKRVALPGLLLILVSAQTASGQVSAERWFERGTWMIGVEVGGAAFSDFGRSQARLVADDHGIGDFDRRVSARTSASLGAWGAWWVLNGVGLRAGLSWTPSAFSVWNEAAAERMLQERGTGQAADYAGLDIWMAEATVVLKFPHNFGRVTPYVLAGGGVVRYSTGDDESIPPEARGRFPGGGRQHPSAVIGVGAAIPLQRRNLLLTFELKNHIARSPLAGSGGSGTFELSGVALQLQQPNGAGPETEVGFTSHVRLSAGLTLPFR